MSTYAWVALIPTAIAVALGIYAWRHRDRPGALSLLALMATLLLWCGGYALELVHSGLPWKIVAAKIQYLGIPLVPVAWLLLALSYTRSLGGVSRRAVAALTVIPALTILLAWTNELHGMLWAHTALYHRGEMSLAIFSYGPWFAVNVTYSYGLMFFASALFLRTMMMQSMYSRQSLGLFTSAALPWVANLMHVTGLSPAHPLDLTPFAFTLGGLGIVLSLRRYRFLELAPVARTAVVDRLRDAVIVVDTAGRVIDLNPAAQVVIGIRDGDTVGAPVRDLFPGVPALIEAANSDAESRGEILIGKGEDEARYAMYVAPIHETGGRICGRLITLHDITDLRDAEARVQFLAYRDALTGLPNRELFRDRFGQALTIGRRNGTHVACLFLDLDDFKRVNDHYGHSTGDELLREASARIRAALRDADTIARPDADSMGDTTRPTLGRFGGDEFVVLLQGLEDPAEAIAAAERIVESLREPFELGKSLISVRTSIGIAVAPGDGENVEVLLRNADAAMYAAKQRGGDRVRFFTPAINAKARERVETESGLHHALENDGLTLEYQPVFDLTTGELVSLEATVCWNDPTRGRVAENEFRKVVDETGLSIEIGAWALERAVMQWQKLRAHLPKGRLSLNLSARQLTHAGFVGQILERIESGQLAGAELELELTESALMDDPERSLDVLGRLRDHGVHFAVDEFGTGLFALSQIRALGLNVIKIDASFIQRTDDPTYSALVRAILAVAAELNVDAAAGGIETGEQLDFLRTEGCRLGQGSFLANPLAFERALALVQQHEGGVPGLRATA